MSKLTILSTAVLILSGISNVCYGDNNVSPYKTQAQWQESNKIEEYHPQSANNGPI